MSPDLTDEGLQVVRRWARERRKFNFYDMLEFVSLKGGNILPWALWVTSPESLENSLLSFGVAIVGLGGSYLFTMRKSESGYNADRIRTESPQAREVFERMDYYDTLFGSR